MYLYMYMYIFYNLYYFLLIIQLRRYIKQSIPDDMRGQAWNKMIGSQAIRVISSFNYLVIITLKRLWKC